jgi:hypothetical protein
MNIDAYLNPEYGIMDYLLEQKKAGRIRHLGFSCHGNINVLKRFLEAYGKHMEFCQLQLKSQTTSSTGGLILPFKGMVLCVPLRHGSQHHWYYWLASLRRLILILH